VLKTAVNTACGVHAPVPAVQQAPVLAAAARPNPQVVTVEPLPLPGLEQQVAADNQVFERQAASFGWPASRATHESANGARMRIRYNYQGHAEEEYFMITALPSRLRWLAAAALASCRRTGITGSARIPM
jgi:hypothetical protein